MATKTWKQRIGKRLMKHVADTTTRCTLAEVMANIKHHEESGDTCFDCLKIARKLGKSKVGAGETAKG